MMMAGGSSKNHVLPVSSMGLERADSLHPKPSSSALTKRGAYAALSYMTCMICSTSILYVMRRWKIISFTMGESYTASADSSTSLVPMETLLHTLPLALSYLLYMLASMESVRGINVPMYTAIRRTTVVFTMIVEYLLTAQKYSSSIIASVAVIVFGAFIAGARDLSYDFHGYAIVLVSNIATAIYLATIARIGKSSGLNSFGLMWCNGLICGPILLLWTYFRGELGTTVNFSYLYSPGFQAVMLLSCIMAFFLNYSIFLNTTLNSAVTQTMCGNLKVVFGSIFFEALFIADFINWHPDMCISSGLFYCWNWLVVIWWTAF
ncbi:hypothetical protein AMTRI_Chr13g122020 [Amborella trichopoda]